MDIFLIIGIIIGFLAIIAGMLAKGADISVLLNSEAFMIICIGTIASVMNSFPRKEFLNIPKILRVLFRGKQKDDPVSLIKEIVELAKETRKNGLLSLEGATQNMDNRFLKTGMEMVVDGVEPEYVREVLSDEISSMEERHRVGAMIFSTAGGNAPTLGVLGAVVGLIGALGSLSDTTKLAHSIASAFVATLYGIFIGYVICIPFSLRLKRKSSEEAENKGWLLPYSDMLTLLLALFIVMFAMSQVDKAKFKNISKQFNVIFAGGSGILVSDVNNSLSKHKPKTSENNIGVIEQNNMLEMKYALEQEIKNSGYDDKIKVELNGEGLNISIQDTVLFNSGDAEILNSFYPLLNQISKMVKKLDNDIKICGYTDNVPISKSDTKFRSNWDLSYMRGSNVMNFMVNTGHISQNKFSIQAYGEYKPKYDNSTDAGKAKNRRVEIIIIRKFLSEHQKTIK